MFHLSLHILLSLVTSFLLLSFSLPLFSFLCVLSKFVAQNFLLYKEMKAPRSLYVVPGSKLSGNLSHLGACSWNCSVEYILLARDLEDSNLVPGALLPSEANV